MVTGATDPPFACQALAARPLEPLFRYGVLPQGSPLVVSYALLLFEGNVRGATVLGLLGPGSVGLELTNALRLYNYSRMFAITISIIVLVTIIDSGSALIRK